MIYVTFDKETSVNIQYFIATDSPREFMTQVVREVTNNGHFKINTLDAKIIRPLKPFFLYMRNIMFANHVGMPSWLSKPIQCATQGIEPKFVKPEGSSSGIFLRWDTPEKGMTITRYVIQFLNNGTSDPLVFTDEMVGTYESLSPFVSWNDIKGKLEKISVKNSNNSKWTEVSVPGNVTGLYIVNTDEVNVRILGSVQENGELFNQDVNYLQYLNWTNIKSTNFNLAHLTIDEIGSRSVDISWTDLDTVHCAYICSVMKQAIQRDEVMNCEKM